MPVFWSHNRPQLTDPVYQRSRGAHPSSRARTPAGSEGPIASFGEPGLTDEDWSQIDALLASAAGGPVASSDRRVAELLDAIERLRSLADAPFVVAAGVIDQLLTIWELASDIGWRVAMPIETLLCSLSGRELATAYELNVACAQARAAALGS